MEEQVILVDDNDRERGVMGKMEAHRRGELHRAFSVFIFNGRGEMLLQQRAAGKYHSAGLFTNACCSHPRPGEEIPAAAHRRLKEEMGLQTTLTWRTSFIYKSLFENGLTEHELDHVLEGHTEEDPSPDPEEVQSYVWLTVKEVKKRIAAHPEDFTTWFRIAMEKLY
jgi:isopentenyl-diphosphate Delta-isomerase